MSDHRRISESTACQYRPLLRTGKAQLGMKIANVALRGMNEYGTKVRDWLQEGGPEPPDIVTLQKIGLNEEFPEEALHEVDYKSTFLGNRSGQYPTGLPY